jgi:hypothetical protein
MRLRWGRVRVPLVWLALLLVLVSAFTDVVPFLLGFGCLVVALAFYFRLGTPPKRDPVLVAPPVVGRWRALNSPADKVPSHGLHAYGQTYAIDLIEAPRSWDDSIRWWPPGRRPETFASFDQPVLSPVDGVVVRVHARERDHWSRDSWPGFLYLLLEGSVRELLGPSRVLGNHVVIDAGDGVWAVLAHLRRGSVKLEPGDRVRTGHAVASCGNSGNSSEPHLHFQLQDHRSVLFADGVPFTFAYRSQGRARTGVPGNEQDLVVDVDDEGNGHGPGLRARYQPTSIS